MPAGATLGTVPLSPAPHTAGPRRLPPHLPGTTLHTRFSDTKTSTSQMTRQRLSHHKGVEGVVSLVNNQWT